MVDSAAVRFLVTTVLLATAGAGATEVTVDVFSNRQPISRGIYGLNLGTDQQLQRLGITVRRFGGNQLSRYNYLSSTTNEGGDGHFFKNLVLVDGGPGDFADRFISASRQSEVDVVLELPLLGYVSRPGSATAAPFTCGFQVSKYGAQDQTDPLDPDCGNGLFPDGGPVTGNSPLDTSVSIDAGFWAGWVQHLTATFGRSTDGGVRYYELGNQPALWNVTHRDVHPLPTTYDEASAQFAASATVVKQLDPGALTLGPSEWGWLHYFDSAALEAGARMIHFVPYYLRQAHTLALARGYRTLDYLDLHIYPQNQHPNTTAIVAGDTSPSISALRLRSTRILWDPTYQLESWESCCYDTVMRLIPRMREWVAQEYPGTGLSFSGYSWGAPNHLSGALAQAEVLGIFGREGVELAMFEGDIPDGALIEDAFTLYRNFDGVGSGFGSLSVRTTTDEPDRVSAYGGYDLSGRITVVLINKDPSLPATVNLTLTSVAGGSFRAYGFGSLGRLAATGQGTLSGSVLTRTLPAYSAELVELTPSGFVDAGVVDAGLADAGSPDAGLFDGGLFDAGGLDASVPDAGASDAGSADGGVRDAGANDGGANDAGGNDAGPSDAGAADAGGRDAGPNDAGHGSDGGPGADASVADSGMDQPPVAGCGCSSSGSLGLALVVAAGAWRRRRPR